MKRITELLSAAVLGAVVSSGCASSGELGRASAAPPATGRFEGTVQLEFGRRLMSDHSGVVVYLEKVPGRVPDATAHVHEIRQIEKQFVPDVAVVLRGATVTFPNDDKIDHNVYSTSKAAAFDLGYYKSGTTKEVRMKKAGEVEIFCNVHQDMAAKVLVLDTAFYDMSDQTGHFSIRGIPPGTYRYQVWQAWGDGKSGKVTIEAGETSSLDVKLRRRKKPRGKKKDGGSRILYPD